MPDGFANLTRSTSCTHTGLGGKYITYKDKVNIMHTYRSSW